MGGGNESAKVVAPNILFLPVPVAANPGRWAQPIHVSKHIMTFIQRTSRWTQIEPTLGERTCKSERKSASMSSKVRVS